MVQRPWLPRWRRLVAAALTLAVLAACTTEPGGPTGLAAPSNVVTEAGPGYVVVSWNHAGTQADGFTIHREPGADAAAAVHPSAEPLATVGPDVRSFVDRDIDVDTEYTYAVSAFNEATSTAATTAPGAATVESGVDIVAGVRQETGFDGMRTNLLVYFFLAQPYREVEPKLTITGPAGWGDPIEFDVGLTFVNRGWIFLAGLYVPLAGTYTLELDADGTVFTASTTLDVSSPFEPASNLTGTAGDDVVVSWDAVPGAVTYIVSLLNGPVGTGAGVIGSASTTATSHTFQGLSLDPGEYGVGITSYPVAWAPPLLPLKPAAFHTSFAAGTFVVDAED